MNFLNTNIGSKQNLLGSSEPVARNRNEGSKPAIRKEPIKALLPSFCKEGILGEASNGDDVEEQTQGKAVLLQLVEKGLFPVNSRIKI